MGGVAFVWAVGFHAGRVEKRHRDVLSRKVDNRFPVSFAQFQCLTALADDGACGTHYPSALCGTDLDMVSHCGSSLGHFPYLA
ncbi:MAG: hypothetical protein ACJA1F_003413 [Paracoccaceae bacterium]|jgi:hypothetical protein